jgi:hypothetical protein
MLCGRFDSDNKEWKERGVGRMKILLDEKTGKVRLLMRREQVLKVCCNHYLTPDLEFKPMTTSDKAVIWCAEDFSEGELKTETFALRFPNSDLVSKTFLVLCTKSFLQYIVIMKIIFLDACI